MLRSGCVAIQGVLYLHIRELLLDKGEIELSTEGEVVQDIAEVECYILLALKHHDDVVVGVGWNVEVAWHSIDLNMTLKLAAFLVFNLLNSIINHSTSVVLTMLHKSLW